MSNSAHKQKVKVKKTSFGPLFSYSRFIEILKPKTVTGAPSCLSTVSST